MCAEDSRWSEITWDDLEDWAGRQAIGRGRAYQRSGRVRDLVVSKEGRLLASVRGNSLYATSVWLVQRGGKNVGVESVCTCPVGSNGCKHAVAVIAEYLEQVSLDEDVPTAEEDDSRWAALKNGSEDKDVGEDEEFRDESQDEVRGKRRIGKRDDGDWGKRIRKYVEGKNREELAEMVIGLMKRFPELQDELREQILLSEGDAGKLVAEARRELRRLTTERGWRNKWTGEGYTPNFEKLKNRLERMLEMGHADEVVKLGREVIEKGMEAVGMSDDEGETAEQVASCMPAIFKAVGQSSLTGARRLLFTIDASLADEYDMVGEPVAEVLDKKYSAEDWGEVAEELSRRLEADKGSTADSSRSYFRDCLSGWLAEALRGCKKEGEVLALYEREAPRTKSYQRLVAYLTESGRYEDAEKWACEGITATLETHRGIAWSLAGALEEVARLRERWEVVAAHAAWAFLTGPSVDTYGRLVQAGEKAGCREDVKNAALRFLETGVGPVARVEGKERGIKKEGVVNWVVPMPRYLVELMREGAQPEGPRYEVLIRLAIHEGRFEEAISWYEKRRADKSKSASGMYRGFGNMADEVAEAVEKTHPEWAVGVYLNSLNDKLNRTGNSVYEEVAAYLKRMRPLMKGLGREDAWKQHVVDIRQKYRNRPRLMEALDRMEGKTVIQTQRERR